MIIMSNITKNHAIGVLSVVLAASLFVGTFAITSGSIGNSAFAFNVPSFTYKSNFADQFIGQAQKNTQSSQCLSGLVSAIDCNNIATQLGLNFGSSVLGQK